MDEVFIQALITQALAAYNKGGAEALAQWKLHLPAPHREQFERDCGERLQAAIEAIDPVEEESPELHTESDEGKGKTQRTDPRKKHTRDQRRTKPL